jgi:hypothetical protein
VTAATIAEPAEGPAPAGRRAGGRVAVLAASRPEWTVRDLTVAGTARGANVFPGYHNNPWRRSGHPGRGRLSDDHRA